MAYVVKQSMRSFKITNSNSQNFIMNKSYLTACNGVLINRRFVLITAHCALNEKAEENRTIEEIYSNQTWKVFFGFHDVSLIKNFEVNQTLHSMTDQFSMSVEKVILVLFFFIYFKKN